MNASPQSARLARALLRLRRLGDRREDVEADLLELMTARSEQVGLRAAQRQFLRDVVSLWWHRAPRPSRRSHSHHPIEVHAMWQDIVFALRLFRRQRMLAGIVIGSVMLAIGLTTALFGLLNVLVWPDMGIREPARVFSIDRSSDRGSFQAWNYTELSLLQRAGSVGVVAAIDGSQGLADKRGDNPGHPLALSAVSGNYFDFLGGRALAGRLLKPADDEAGAAPVIVISEGLWRWQFASDRGIVGRTLWMGDRPVTVAGVMERGFAGTSLGMPPAFWISLSTYREISQGDRAAQAARIREQIRLLATDSSASAVARRQAYGADLTRLFGPWAAAVNVFGRLSPDATAAQAASELTALARAPRLAEGDKPGARLIDVRLSPVADLHANGDSETLAKIAIAILSLVLLIACINISNVLVAGAAARRREVGTRLALGARRLRIVRQLLTESCVLGLIGGIAGLLLAAWLMPLLGRLLDLPPQIDLSLDGRVYLFAAVCTTAAAIGAGLMPALYGRRGDLLGAIKSAASSGAGRLPASRLRGWLIGGQTTAAVLLLVCAALFTRALVHVTSVQLGFRPDQLMSVEVSLGREYDGVRRLQFWDAALDRVRRVPGVRDAAVAGYGPMGRGTSVSDAVVSAPADAGTDVLGGSLRRFHRNFTTAGYFSTIGLPLLRGRSYTDDEVRNGAPVAVISESLARAAWGDTNPLGSSLERVWGPDDPSGAPHKGFFSKPAGTRVIGVVPDTVTTFMRPSTAMIYLPFDDSIFGPLLVSAANPSAVSLPVQEALRALDVNSRPMVAFVSDGLRSELRTPRALALLAQLLGITSLTLAAVGLFGVAAFAVDLRRYEVSVRMALGATGRAVVRMLMRDCLRPVALGAAVGLVLAPLGARLLRVALFGVSPYDPWAVVGAAVVLALAAGWAVFIPARRASRVNPVTLLKAD